MLDLVALAALSEDEILEQAQRDPAWFAEVAELFAAGVAADRKDTQLAYYTPANPMAAPVHNSTAREIAIVGGNRSSVPLTAPILMADGSWKALGAISLADRVMAADPATREARPARVVRVFRSGYEEVFRYTLSDGGTFDATKTHHVPVCNARRGATPELRLLEDVWERITTASAKHRVSVVSPSVFEFDAAVTPSLDPYTLGALVGDGCLSGMPLRFANTDPGVIDRVRAGVALLGLTMVQYDAVPWGLVSYEGSRLPSRNAPGNPLRALLTALGLYGCRSYEKRVPREVFRYTHRDRLMFLAGLLDTDGAADSYCTVSPGLAEDFRRLVKLAGGRATLRELPTAGRPGAQHVAFVVYWNVPHRLPMTLTRKQANTGVRDTTKRPMRSATSLGSHECGDIEIDDPAHCYVTGDYVIVSNSKTDTMLAEFAIQLTGHIPLALQATYPREKIRSTGIRARLCCNSLTDTLEPIIKPKLRWDQWNGIGAPDEGRGHWGWIPRHCLIGGTWEKSYSEKTRTLTVANDNQWVGADGTRFGVRNISTCQMMSYDQDLSAYVGSSLHLVGHDELPPTDVYRENRLRTLDVRGTIMTAFTPPDEGGISRADTAWFYDHVFQLGLPGPNKSPIIDTFQLFTEQNSVLGKREVEELLTLLTDDQRRVRLHGEFIHLSGVIYKDFATSASWWCFACNKRIVPMYGHCLTCQGQSIAEYLNVIEPHPIPKNWPVVFVIDPHPRKKDAIGWFAVTPMDDLVMIAELETDGTAQDVARDVKLVEDALEIRPSLRLMDPNIAVETNDKLKRGWTIQREYDEAGLRCKLANDEINVGIDEVLKLIRPDRLTQRPRLRAFSTCRRFVHGMTHWAFDDWSRQGDREPKEKVRDVAKDFPDLARYLALERVTYRGLTMSHAQSSRRKPPVRGY